MCELQYLFQVEYFLCLFFNFLKFQQCDSYFCAEPSDV